MNKIIGGQSRVVVQQYTIDTAVPSAVVIQDGFNPAIIIDIKPPDPNGSSYATDIDFITIFPMPGKIVIRSASSSAVAISCILKVTP